MKIPQFLIRIVSNAYDVPLDEGEGFGSAAGMARRVAARGARGQDRGLAGESVVATDDVGEEVTELDDSAETSFPVLETNEADAGRAVSYLGGFLWPWAV